MDEIVIKTIAVVLFLSIGFIIDGIGNKKNK